jgi:glutamate-ammonia-ligase adenylyltransferase
MRAELKKTIESLCPEVSQEIIQDFFARMDEDYFALYSPEEVCTHLRMSGALDLQHPVRCQIRPRNEASFDIIIVGFDYLSEFSIFCGLLSAFGFDIRAGNIYSFAWQEAAPTRPRRRAKGSPRPTPRKIVDVFNVRLKSGESFDTARQSEFERELQTLIRLLAAGAFQEARERLNRYLIEQLEKANEPLSGLLHPVEVHFDNHTSPDWTVMEVYSQDSPAFLYAFSNALAMRGIYIHKVRIRSIGQQVQDQFFISDRWGRKIEDEREQKALEMAVVLIKCFTHFLFSAPDPAKAMRHFDQFLDRVLEEKIAGPEISFFVSGEGLNLLAHLLGSSDFLWEDFLRLHFKDLLPLLEGLAQTDLKPGKEQWRRQLAAQLAQATTYAERKRVLNDFKDHQVFLIDVKHLLEPQVTLIDFSHALTELAELVLEEAYRICHEHLARQYGQPRQSNGAACPFAICGLGKFGGREIGYASDLEVLFIYGGPGQTQGSQPIDNGLYFELLVQQLIEFIETRERGIFHLDLRLRPYGKAGPLASPFEQVMSYYSDQGEAAPFERQALIKLRWVAGDQTLGRMMEAHRDRFTYSGRDWDLKTALHLRQRQVRELVEPGKINVKYSPGGIIEVEYAAQYLQIAHGKEHPELRTTSTLEALDRLCQLRLISEKEHADLRQGYLFLRTLIDALRIVRGNARDLILPEVTSEEFKALARRLNYRERDWEKGARRLAEEIQDCMNRVHSFYLARFTPLLSPATSQPEQSPL